MDYNKILNEKAKSYANEPVRRKFERALTKLLVDRGFVYNWRYIENDYQPGESRVKVAIPLERYDESGDNPQNIIESYFMDYDGIKLKVYARRRGELFVEFFISDSFLDDPENFFSESTKSNKELMNEEYLPYDGAVYRAEQMYKALERQFGTNIAKSAFQTVADEL